MTEAATFLALLVRSIAKTPEHADEALADALRRSAIRRQTGLDYEEALKVLSRDFTELVSHERSQPVSILTSAQATGLFRQLATRYWTQGPAPMKEYGGAILRELGPAPDLQQPRPTKQPAAGVGVSNEHGG